MMQAVEEALATASVSQSANLLINLSSSAVAAASTQLLLNERRSQSQFLSLSPTSTGKQKPR